MDGTTQSVAKESRLIDAYRPWVSLWLTIHFFALSVCLAANLSSSELERRILNVLAPYTVGLHQDYGGVPLDMVSGTELDFAHAFEVHRSGAADDSWQSIAPLQHFASTLDYRWRSFVRTTVSVGTEQNQELVFMLFQRCLASQVDSNEKIDGVRLVRRATLSYLADQERGMVAPAATEKDRVLIECRVVELSNGRVRLLPVLEATRTSKSLATPSGAPAVEPSLVVPPAGNSSTESSR